MATIKDIAKATGLSLATISKYLNGGTLRPKNREAVDAAIRELDFTVNEFARGLKSNQSRTIGVVIPELSNLFVTTILTAMEDVLRRQGYGILICDCRTDGEQEAEAVRFLLCKRVDGIVSMPVSRDGAHLLPALEKEIPILLLDRMIPALEGKVSAVLVDNAGAARSATKLLLGAGHINIGILLGPEGVYTSRQRKLGFRQALAGVGLIAERQWVAYSDYTVEGGYESARALLTQREPPTALFVTNYEMTLGAVIAVNELGIRVPEQLSIIGFDNQHLSAVVRPALTVVTQPLGEMGAAAADLLLEQLGGAAEGESGPKITTLPTGIQQGESIAGPERP